MYISPNISTPPSLELVRDTDAPGVLLEGARLEGEKGYRVLEFHLDDEVEEQGVLALEEDGPATPA